MTDTNAETVEGYVDDLPDEPPPPPPADVPQRDDDPKTDPVPE